jgi:hypothetical protein
MKSERMFARIGIELLSGLERFVNLDTQRQRVKSKVRETVYKVKVNYQI